MSAINCGHSPVVELRPVLMHLSGVVSQVCDVHSNGLNGDQRVNGCATLCVHEKKLIFSSYCYSLIGFFSVFAWCIPEVNRLRRLQVRDGCCPRSGL
jgi:hypothetical protein